MRGNSAECFIGNAVGAFRAREIRRWGPQDRWDKENHQQYDWSAVEDDRRKMDSRQTISSSGPHSILSAAGLREHESRGRESPRKTLISLEPRSDAKAAMPSKTTKGAQAHSDRCRLRLEACLRNTWHGAERLDRRNEIINEGIGLTRYEEGSRGGRNRSDRVTVAAQGTEPAADSVTTEIRRRCSQSRNLCQKSLLNHRFRGNGNEKKKKK